MSPALRISPLCTSRVVRRNVPVRQMSEVEQADIEKKAQEIERGIRTEDIDEDDAGKQALLSPAQLSDLPRCTSGVKRPSESHHPDDGNSNPKPNRSNRNDFIYDNEYNPSR